MAEASGQSLHRTADFQALPPEVLDIVCQFMGQANAHSALRTCRAIYWALGPRAWRKIVLAPNPEWVDINVRPNQEDWSIRRSIGQVSKGFLRTKRLLAAITEDFDRDSLVEGRWRYLSECRELTICEFMEPSDMAALFSVLPNVRKTNLYMGNFLHWYRETIGGIETSFEILPYNPPQIPELWAGERTPGMRPRMLCEVLPKCLSPWRGISWTAHNITNLNIDCEAHLQADFNHTRFHFVDELYAAYRLHNKNCDAWFETFRNIQILKCGSWFLELLWASCFLENVTRGTGFVETNWTKLNLIRNYGIGGLPKLDQWVSLHSVTIQGFEDEYPEIQYRRDRSIISPHLWTFLGVFRSLKTIRCEVGPWKRLHRYPGGFDLVPHIESLVGLAALQICQEIHGWDVKIEDFIINLRDIETLTTPEPPAAIHHIENPAVPALPVVPTVEGLGRLLDFIHGIGWTGFVSIPDTTNWWDGPTWKFWLPRVVPPAPENFNPMGRNFPNNMMEQDYIPWELVPGDPYPTSVKILLEHYISAIEFRQDWKKMEKGLYIYHESCWYRSLLHPRYRHMANAKYDEQLSRFLCTKQRVKGLGIATNNWKNFESAWNDLEDVITDIYIDAFDYRVTNIISDPAMPLTGFRPEMELWSYHSRADTYETLSEMPELRNLAIVNFQWAFDADNDEDFAPDPSAYGALTQHIIEIPGSSNSIQSFKLIGDMFYKVPPEDEAEFVGNEEQRKLARVAVTSKFNGGGNKVDLSWMRFKYLNQKEWDVMMQPGAIGKRARARVRFETNDIPAFNRYPTWETWDEINQWKEVEIQGWKVYENTEGYPVIIDETRMWLDVSLTDAGYDGTLEEKMAAWSARLHKEKDAPYDPVVLFFARWHRTMLSRFRMQIRDFYAIHPWGHV